MKKETIKTDQRRQRGKSTHETASLQRQFYKQCRDRAFKLTQAASGIGTGSQT